MREGVCSFVWGFIIIENGCVMGSNQRNKNGHNISDPPNPFSELPVHMKAVDCVMLESGSNTDDTLVTNTGMVFFSTDSIIDTTNTCSVDKQPIRARYLGHVTVYQPIRDQYFSPMRWCSSGVSIKSVEGMVSPPSHFPGTTA